MYEFTVHSKVFRAHHGTVTSFVLFWQTYQLSKHQRSACTTKQDVGNAIAVVGLYQTAPSRQLLLWRQHTANDVRTQRFIELCRIHC